MLTSAVVLSLLVTSGCAPSSASVARDICDPEFLSDLTGPGMLTPSVNEKWADFYLLSGQILEDDSASELEIRVGDIGRNWFRAYFRDYQDEKSPDSMSVRWRELGREFSLACAELAGGVQTPVSEVEESPDEALAEISTVVAQVIPGCDLARFESSPGLYELEEFNRLRWAPQTLEELSAESSLNAERKSGDPLQIFYEHTNFEGKVVFAECHSSGDTPDSNPMVGRTIAPDGGDWNARDDNGRNLYPIAACNSNLAWAPDTSRSWAQNCVDYMQATDAAGFWVKVRAYPNHEVAVATIEDYWTKWDVIRSPQFVYRNLVVSLSAGFSRMTDAGVDDVDRMWLEFTGNLSNHSEFVAAYQLNEFFGQTFRESSEEGSVRKLHNDWSARN